MAQFYSLEEAARMLGVSPDELKRMAERGELRPFRDRGNVHFRAQEVEERARQRGRGSDPELQIAADPPSSKRTKKPADPDEAFNPKLSPEDQVEIGQELEKEGSSKKGGRSGAGTKSPVPKPGSDSDVRLVADGSDLDFQVADDAQVRMVEDKAGKPDSSVRILPLEVQSDSDVKIVPEGHDDPNVVIGGQKKKTGSDSDIRLVPEAGGPPSSGVKGKGRPPSEVDLVTEEIDLDAEEAALRKSESARNLGKAPKTMKPKKGETSAQSPFELSDPKMGKPKEKDKAGKKTTESSSDFELTVAPSDQSPLDMSSDEEVTLGEISGAAGGSGINLQDPADSGISLEQSGAQDVDELEAAAAGPTTPKPGPVETEDSDSEFELSLDADSSGDQPAAKEKPDSDSEFELTLEDSGDLLPLEKGGSAAKGEGQEDIFETDFEVPALDEDSGSEAVALDESDTDLESSDFDLALNEQDASAEQESGSEVVALEDEEHAEPGASTVAKPRPVKKAKKPTPVAEEEEEIVEEEEEEPAYAGAVAAAPAEWGILPALVLLPTVVLMFFVAVMGFEMIRTSWGYRTGTPVVAPVSKAVVNIFGDSKNLP